MAEAYTIKMPKLSDTMTEGTVVTWEKQVGEQIARAAYEKRRVLAEREARR